MRRAVPLVLSAGEEEGLRGLMAEGDKEEYRRCLAILLRARGMSNQDVAAMMDVTKRSLERWIRAYRACGITGLRRKPRPGSRPRVTQDQRKIMSEIALKSPRAFGYLKNEWSVRLLARHLTRMLGIKIGKSHVWNILHELGIVYKRPKAVVKSPDPEYEEKASRVEEYKREALTLLKGGLW